MATPSTSALNTNVNIKIKVLTCSERRTSRFNGESVVFNAIDSNSKMVKEVFSSDMTEAKFQVGKFYLLRNVTVGAYIRISQNTKVMQCTKFDFDSTTEESFYSPPEVSVREALRSPSKRRLSVTGILTDESEIKESGGTRRKILRLTTDDECIEVKLWGNQVTRSNPPIGTEVVVTCVNVNQYKGKTEVNSTILTDIKELSTETDFKGIIEAVDFESETPTLMLKDSEEVLQLSSDQLKDIFPTFEIEDDVVVTGRKLGAKILTIHREEEDLLL